MAVEFSSLLEHVLLPWMDDVAPQEEVDEDAEYWAQLEAKENGEEEPEDDFNPQVCRSNWRSWVART
jgi:GTP-binding protein